MTRIAVLGAGSWGTAFAAMLADSGHQTTLWARRPELAEAITATGENPDYLPGVPLPPSLNATHDAAAALADARFVILALPSQSLRANLVGWVDLLPADALLVSLMKGVELGSTLRMSQVIAEVTAAEQDRLLVVTGPNLSHEIARKLPAASVVACVDEDNARELQRRLRQRLLPPVHPDRRRGLRARRRHQERHRHRGGHVRTAWAWATTLSHR